MVKEESSSSFASEHISSTRHFWGKALVIVLSLMAILWAVYSFIIAPLSEPLLMANRVIDASHEIGLSLVSNGFSSSQSGITLVVNEEKNCSDLVTTEQTFHYQFTYEDQWLFSKKTLVLKAGFRALGGIHIDPKNPIQIIIPTTPQKSVSVHELKGKLISCEMIEGSLEVVKDKSGWWNYLSQEDSARAINAMIGEAKKYALEKGIEKKAELNFIDFLNQSKSAQPKGQIIFPKEIQQPEPLSCLYLYR